MSLKLSEERLKEGMVSSAECCREILLDMNRFCTVGETRFYWVLGWMSAYKGDGSV